MSFSSASMLQTTVTWLIEDGGGHWIWDVIDSSWVSPSQALDPPALSGQLCPICPCFLQLKQYSSLQRVVCSSLVRAALAQVCPGIRSMAFRSLANFCCHCWHVGFWGWFLWLPQREFAISGSSCVVWWLLQPNQWSNQIDQLLQTMAFWSLTGSPFEEPVTDHIFINSVGSQMDNNAWSWRYICPNPPFPFWECRCCLELYPCS